MTTVSDLNFPELREYVENNTYLPEFHEIERRARRRRGHRRMGTGAAVLGALALCAPVVIGGGTLAARLYSGAGTSVIGISGDNHVVRIGTPATTAPPVVTRTLVAADGVDLEHVYGLVDVCADTHCSLQLSTIDPGGITGTTQRLGLFRTRPTDVITDARIVALNDHTVIVSATLGTGLRQSETIPLTAAGTTPTVMARPVQPTEQGDIRMAGTTGTVSSIPRQPSVTSPSLACSQAGWWVSGIDPVSGELAVSVSSDQGHTWTTHPVGILADSRGTAVATTDGVNVYLLANNGGQLVLLRSTDGGGTWAPTATQQTWSPGTSYGMIARSDGSLLIWITRDQVTSYLRSTDGGASFVPDEGPPGPGGPIVTLRDGFLALGTSPALSHDGVTWASAYVPWVNVTS